MANPIKISEYLKKHRLNVIMRRFLIGAASVVVFVTTYMLILPAITLELQSLNNSGASVSSNDASVSSNDASGSVSGNNIFSNVSSGDLITGTETPEEWEKLIEDVELTGNWPEDIIAIAKTQLGYQESTGNYVLGEDGMKRGYTRYGDWYGESYGDWSAMFVSFCLNYAQVSEDMIPREANCQRWIEALSSADYDRYRAAAAYTPVAGDLIFLDLNGDGEAEHAGIIESVPESAEDDNAQIKAIVGDFDNAVQYNTYSLQSSEIIGYGRMEKPSILTYKKSYSDEKVVITARYTENAQIPEDAELLAYQVTAETAPERYENRQQETHAALQALKEAENNEADNEELGALETEPVGAETVETEVEEPETDYLIYNIGFYVDGQELEPADAVTISIQFLSEDGFAVGDPITIVHFSEDGTETLTGAEVTQDENGALTTSFETTNFSDFAIVSDMPVVYAATNQEKWVGTQQELYNALTQKFNSYGNVNNDSGEYFNGTIKLENDITITADSNWATPGIGGPDSSERNVTIDLNGHDITVAGTLVDIHCNATLEIIDTSTVKDEASLASGNLYGNAAYYEAGANGSEGTWNYYVTETQPTGTTTGKTTETLRLHKVSGGGVITGTGTGTAVFYMRTDKQDADKPSTLTINGGIIANSANRVVDMHGGVLNLNGGYLFGNKVYAANGNGGAIYATSENSAVTVNLSGTVLAGNTAYNGGAINIVKGEYDAKLDITDGVVSGNTATNNGGGIRVENCTVTMNGGYITNNISQDTEYYDGGGGVLMIGSTNFTLNRGYITGNNANSGGGIYTYTGQPLRFTMNGGFVTANYAREAEGGGIRIDADGIGTFTGGYITNNRTNTSQHWGGGGLFVADNGIAYLSGALITENDADGFGGGVAGCSTGRIYMSAIDFKYKGAAIFDNTAYDPDNGVENSGPNLSGNASAKAEDHIYAYGSNVFMDNGYKDFFCVLYSHVQNGMLGDGSENWSGSIDGVAVKVSECEGQQATANSVIGLTADPNDADKNKAMNEAKLFINGNSSNTHGGGILCNGYTVLGATEDNKQPDSDKEDVEIELGTRIELTGTKQLLDDDGQPLELADKQFSFTVRDASGVEVAKAANDTDGNFIFDRRLVFDAEKDYVFTLTEDKSENLGADIKMDQTEYKITVTTEETELGPLAGSNETVGRIIYKIQRIKVERRVDDSKDWNTVNEVSFENSPVAEQESRGIDVALSSDTTFINYKLRKTDIMVEKVWDGGIPDNVESITVDLYRNDEIVSGADGVKLSAANNWSYTWTKQDVYDSSDNPYVYYVRERFVKDYMADYVITGSGESSSYWVPATSLEVGNKYMIVDSSGQNALMVSHENRGGWFDSDDVHPVAKGNGDKLIGGKLYSDWYDASQITEPKVVFTAQEYSGGVVLKNNGNENSWLSIEYNKDTNGQKLKGTAGVGNIQYATQFMYNNTENILQGRYFNNTGGDDLHTVVYANNKFNALNPQDQNDIEEYNSASSVKLYTLVHTVAGGSTTMTITNTPLSEIDFTLEVTKISEKKDMQGNDILLSGAEFKILDSNNVELKFLHMDDGRYQLSDSPDAEPVMISDENGLIKVTGLKAGTYTLTESKAPPGYEEVDKAFTLDENTSNAKLVLTIEDPLIEYELPETGGNGTNLYTMAGLLMICSAYLLYRKTKDRKEWRL